MNEKKKLSGQSVGALKTTSAKRLVAKLETVYKNGDLKPINPDAKSSLENVRVKKK